MMTVPEPTWIPDAETIAQANVTQIAGELGLDDYSALHQWSVEHRAEFWGAVVERLGIVFRTPPDSVLSQGSDPRSPRWLAGAELNIAESCFQASPDSPAVIARIDGGLATVTYGELQDLVDRFAHGFSARWEPGTRVGIAMPMTVEACAAYLGIVKAGGVVVSIADSFAPEEIASRLEIAGATAVVTQGHVVRGGKQLPMYEKVLTAGARRAIVVDPPDGLRPGDIPWSDFLGVASPYDAVVSGPAAHTNILFSSGTTGEPKAIPWTQLTPIKAAMDGHLHQDIHPGDVVAWPTNLGWMMGPWLIYASLINGAALALFDDAPTGEAFGEFVAEAGVTMLGVVPSLVRAWRESGCMEACDWRSVRVFSSTGEASSASDMAYLMGLGDGRPVIEYCGGTELGGGYITGTVVQPAVPAAFSTPALGLDFVILGEDGHREEEGELFLVPPSIGLSDELVNQDHDDVYYASTHPGPEGQLLRRHGDHMRALGDGYYRALGRVDDTMNLGGIKISSAEIERIVTGVPGVRDAAAVAVPLSGSGPASLVVYLVTEEQADVTGLADLIRERIRSHLNPLFKVHDVVPIDALPRTASNKVMRRELRAAYQEGPHGL